MVKGILVLGVLTAGILAQPSSATTMQAVFVGTALEGSYDYYGDYGAADTDLSGSTVTVTWTYEADQGVNYISGPNAMISANVEINGTTQSFSGEFLSSAAAGSAALYYPDAYAIGAQDYIDTGDGNYDHNLVNTSLVGDIPSLPRDLTTPFSLTEIPDDLLGCAYRESFESSTGLTSQSSYVCFSFTSVTVTEYAPATSVPLPASAWFLSGGLVGLAGFRQTKRRQS